MISEQLTKFKSIPDLKSNYLFPYINDFIRLFRNLEKEAGVEFTNLFVKKRLPAGTFLLREGQVSINVWLLLKGMAIIYKVINGKEFVIHFFIPGEFIDYNQSSVNEQKSDLYIRLTMESELLCANWKDVKQLGNKYPNITMIIRKIVGAHMDKKQAREIRLQSMTSKIHYKYLLENDPYVIEHAKKCDISSYLGITIGSYSRIRGNHK